MTQPGKPFFIQIKNKKQSYRLRLSCLKRWSQHWNPGNRPISPLSPKGWNPTSVQAGHALRSGPGKPFEGSCSWRQDCGGNFSNAQSQFFSSEKIRCSNNNILQERTTQYKRQSCSDRWGKNTVMLPPCPVISPWVLGIVDCFYLVYLPSPNHSWSNQTQYQLHPP